MRTPKPKRPGPPAKVPVLGEGRTVRPGTRNRGQQTVSNTRRRRQRPVLGRRLASRGDGELGRGPRRYWEGIAGSPHGGTALLGSLGRSQKANDTPACPSPKQTPSWSASAPFDPKGTCGSGT